MAFALKTHPLFWKLPLVTLIFGTIIAAASTNLFPRVPMVAALLYATAGIVAFLAMVTVSLIVASRINAYVLNKGGTDAQWLWFKSEPPGLMRLREEARSESDDSLQESEPNVRGRGL